MDRFQVRGSDHSKGSLSVEETIEGTLQLNGEATEDYITLGDPADALLVAKCIEVAARDRYDEDDYEADLTLIEETLAQITTDSGEVIPKNE